VVTPGGSVGRSLTGSVALGVGGGAGVVEPARVFALSRVAHVRSPRTRLDLFTGLNSPAAGATP
jgi:hypothetical protein